MNPSPLERNAASMSTNKSPKKKGPFKSNGDPAWRHFEKLIATIHESARKNAEVKHNHKILGKSGSYRQFDVTIEQTVGPNKMLTVVECRQKNRAVSIEEVDAFVGKLADVNNPQGIMVAPAGFSKGAIGRAKVDKIQLLSYREAAEADWTIKPVLAAIQYVPEWRSVSFQTENGTIPVNLEEEVQLAGNNKPTKLREVVDQIWTVIPKDQLVGEFLMEAEITPPLQLPNGEQAVSVLIDGVVRAFGYIQSPLNFGSGHVLKEAQSGANQIIILHSESVEPQASWRELTPEEAEHINNSPQLIRKRISKRYVRLEMRVIAK